MRNMRTMLTRVHHGETLTWFKLVAQHINQAGVLHAPRYDISGNMKNTPGEHESVLSYENPTVPLYLFKNWPCNHAQIVDLAERILEKQTALYDPI